MSYGHCDTESTVVVWEDRPSSECECEDACDCAARGREARKEQRGSWDSWRPGGFAKGADGQMHAEYEGHEGLVAAIEWLGPTVEEK